MILFCKTLKIAECVIVPVFILVVNVMLRRYRTVRILPHVAMQETAARFRRIKIAAVHLVRAVRIAEIAVPAILENLCLR
jgi:hypothetical protein